VGGLRAAGKKDAHHVIQDAAVRDLPGYNTNAAPAIQLSGPSNFAGTPHNFATGVQRQAGGGTWNAIMALTERGFTGHQHVDRLDLIHMNGRTYDPRLGRFMQADIVVQAPSDSQSYNRYSYVRNNPLNATAASGFLFRKWGQIYFRNASQNR
jgi:RHS repeat-associated protein